MYLNPKNIDKSLKTHRRCFYIQKKKHGKITNSWNLNINDQSSKSIYYRKKLMEKFKIKRANIQKLLILIF